MSAISKSPVSANFGTGHSQSRTSDYYVTTVNPMHPTSKGEDWTLYKLKGYEKESEMLAGKEGCHLPSQLQGMNIYSKYCPVSEPKKVIMELRAPPDRCPNR
jgi:hypothetical protein